MTAVTAGRPRRRSRIIRGIRMLLLFALPTVAVRRLVNLLGYDIAAGARVGFSVILVDSMVMLPGSAIGHFNFVTGEIAVRLGLKAALGHLNLVSGTYAEPAGELVELSLGEWAKITALHTVDVTNSIRIGDFSTLAGHRSQLWTHGYVHEAEGLGRYRIDGEIEIGNNVYVGSGSIISAGVTIGPGAIVGAGTVVSKDLLEPGFYVSSPVRMLPRPVDPETRPGLERVTSAFGDVVYRKRR